MSVPVASAVEVPGGTIGITTWAGAGPRIFALHGFTLRGAMFAAVAGGSNLLAADLPGHGGSRLASVTMDGTVSALARVLEDAGSVGLVVGYSMGGRVALHLALARPDLVPGLLLVSTGLGIEDSEARRARRQADEGLAVALVAMGIEPFVDRWIDHPIAGTRRVPQARRAADRAIRLTNDAAGLAAAIVGLGPAAHEPLHDRLSDLAVPTTWMAGAADATYISVAVDAARRSGGGLVSVPGAGHNLVLEYPDAVRTAMEEAVR